MKGEVMDGRSEDMGAGFVDRVDNVDNVDEVDIVDVIR